MSDEARTVYGLKVVDPLVGHQRVVRYYESREAAERENIERFGGNALVISADGIVGSFWHHDDSLPLRGGLGR